MSIIRYCVFTPWSMAGPRLAERKRMPSRDCSDDRHVEQRVPYSRGIILCMSFRRHCHYFWHLQKQQWLTQHSLSLPPVHRGRNHDDHPSQLLPVESVPLSIYTLLYRKSWEIMDTGLRYTVELSSQISAGV
jgi:hypothetical protein